jgi:hypothetical protein
MAVQRRRVRRPVSRVIAAFSLAATFAFVSPSLAATSPLTTLIKAPYSGAAVTNATGRTHIACATARSPVPAYWNASTGAGGLKIRATATNCGSSSSANYSDVIAYTIVRLPVRLPSGTGGVGVRWTYSLEGRQRLSIPNITSNGSCPKNSTSGPCVGESLFLFDASAYLLDLTNNSTYYSSSGLGIYRWGEDYIDSTSGCYSCVWYDPNLNRTFTHVFNITGLFNSSHNYEIYTWVRAEVTAEIDGWNGTATASLNMATLGHGYVLDAVRIW